ncbi:MAG: XrtA-associated tyrosine autokinase [Burkholderiaceae bacterium]
MGERVSIIEKAASRLGRGKNDAVTPAATGATAQSAYEFSEETLLTREQVAAAHVDALLSAPEDAMSVGIAVTPPTPMYESQTVEFAQSPDLRQHTVKKVEINLQRLAANKMVTSDGGRNPVAEEFRAIKRPLIDNAFSHNGRPVNRNNLIMVTSALPGEGKTFTAINLAISIAMELDHTVLLVDADVARPSVLRTLGLKSETGLMDVLLDGKLDIADVLLKTNIDTLTILPAGKSHRHATELLASQTMSTLLDEIASRYPDRIVIFDSPPLLLTSEARVLASQMGQIVVVVEAETTTMHAVKNALSQLEGCANVNLVYNKAKDFPGQENYGYYYN